LFVIRFWSVTETTLLPSVEEYFAQCVKLFEAKFGLGLGTICYVITSPHPFIKITCVCLSEAILNSAFNIIPAQALAGVLIYHSGTSPRRRVLIYHSGRSGSRRALVLFIISPVGPSKVRVVPCETSHLVLTGQSAIPIAYILLGVSSYPSAPESIRVLDVRWLLVDQRAQSESVGRTE
jgi:hypothetical protein